MISQCDNQRFNISGAINIAIFERNIEKVEENGIDPACKFRVSNEKLNEYRHPQSHLKFPFRSHE